MKRVLVIGGSRFVGARLVRALRDEGTHVTLLNRSGRGAADRIVVGDRSDVACVREGLGGEAFDAIFDFAAYQPRDAESACELFAEHAGPYVLVSSIAVYRLGRDLEEKDFDPSRFAVPAGRPLSYAEGKRAVEHVFATRAPFRHAAVRFPFILGPDDYSGRLELHVRANAAGRPMFFANPHASMSVVSSEEAARAVLWAARERVEGALNVASTSPVSYSALMAIIASQTGIDTTYATKQSATNGSPYDHTSDKFMKLERAKKRGLELASPMGWLPELVAQAVRADRAKA
jgi:nucleoside-diphosphate-sugar epimerase